MPWARYDDRLPTNRKVAWLRAQGESGIAAVGLHLLANTWSRHEGMQGFIPSYMPEQLAGKTGAKLADLLAEAGMFDPVEGGWLIHDYHDFSPKGDDGLSVDERSRRLSRVRSEAGRKGGKAKAAAKQTASKPSSKTVANGWQSSSPDPEPEVLANTSIDRTSSTSTREAADGTAAAPGLAGLAVVRSIAGDESRSA